MSVEFLFATKMGLEWFTAGERRQQEEEEEDRGDWGACINK